jgi:hypothetical protein
MVNTEQLTRAVASVMASIAKVASNFRLPDVHEGHDAPRATASRRDMSVTIVREPM